MAERELRSARLLRLFLAVLSGAMLGFSFPPFELGILACFALVPLLASFHGITRIKHALWYVYVAMFVFHAITVNWTGGFVHGNDPYMMIAGSVTILVHPLFYFLPLGVYLLIRRHFSERLAVLVLPVLWVGYEYSHSLSEWSFPWLTLGNSQTYDLARIQFIEYTGVWGLSFWILVMNALAYFLCLRLARGKEGVRSTATWLLLAALVVVYIAPEIHGLLVLPRAANVDMPSQTAPSTTSSESAVVPGGPAATSSESAVAPASTGSELHRRGAGPVLASALSAVTDPGHMASPADASAQSPGDPAGFPARPVTVGIIQSNVDPWDKWTANGVETYTLYMRLTGDLVDSADAPRPDIVLWPETAFPFDVLGSQNRQLLTSLQERLGTWQIGLLTGLPHRVVYEDSAAAPHSARRDQRSGQRYDWYNAAAYIEKGTLNPAWYGKMKMVPFAERIPYADVFSFVDFLRWDVGIGGWQIGPDTTVFEDTRTGSRFSAIICYESTYPGFVAEFVRKGAEFIVLITIDSWWGKMSGAFQHQQIAVLRAVENRRWIARCAVGGISSYIDPYGRAHEKTELFTQRVLSKRIERRNALSWYTARGDMLGEATLWLALALALAGFVQAFLKRKRKLR
ncbi:MAG TPA: apolipoprotein N-acyltransferase [Bacteroidota bacterium]|nr:apolipoprotein N-acyltransferase [Bacteroidota bacterium]